MNHWRRSPRVLWRAAPSYLVVGSIAGEVMEIAGPGVAMWEELDDWVSESDLAHRLADRYHANQDDVAADVVGLLRRLHAGGYVDSR